MTLGSDVRGDSNWTTDISISRLMSNAEKDLPHRIQWEDLPQLPHLTGGLPIELLIAVCSLVDATAHPLV